MNMKIISRIAIVLAIVGLGGWLIWRAADKPKTTEQTPEATTPASISYEKAPDDWQNYASASMGIKVSYPQDWQQGSCGSGCVTFGPKGDEAQPVIGINASKGTLADVVAQAAPYQQSKEEVKIGTTNWTKLVLQEPQTKSVFISHFIEHRGTVYEFGLADQSTASAAIYGKMLSSFGFTK